MKLIKIIILASFPFWASADIVKFEGDFYKFEIEVAGTFSLEGANSQINQMLTNFLQSKGDLEAVKEFYDDESKETIEQITSTEEGRAQFMGFLASIQNLRARAKWTNGEDQKIFLHVNEGQPGELIIESGISFVDSVSKLKYSQITIPPGGTPSFWIGQIWNSFKATEPTISASE